MPADFSGRTHAELAAALNAAIDALRTILAGAQEDGRWLDGDDGAVDGAKKDGPPDGCYMQDEPPPGYDRHGWCGDLAQEPDEPLVPVRWEEYTKEEQASWLHTCALIAKHALKDIGVPLVEPKTEEPADG